MHISELVNQCHSSTDLYQIVSGLCPTANSSASNMHVMSPGASGTIPISLIRDKFMEISVLEHHFTPEEQANHRKVLEKIKSIHKQACPQDDWWQEIDYPKFYSQWWQQYKDVQLRANLQAYLLDPSATGDKVTAAERIKAAFNFSDQCIGMLGAPYHFSDKHLRLVDLGLNKLPACLSMLTKLQHLYLNDNKLTELPSSIGRLTQLQSLSLRNNKLTELPSSIDGLVQLRILDLNKNQLTTLPSTIGGLVQLQSLDLRENQLIALPSTIGRLTQLQRLDLDHNKLINLPLTIGELVRLQSLGLGDNQLTELPSTIDGLAQLQRLNLDCNELIDLPLTIGGLVQLQGLSLEHNHNLRELPFTLGSIQGLTSIYTDDTLVDPQMVQAILDQSATLRRVQASVVLSSRLQMWLTAGRIQLDLSAVERFTDEEKGIVNEWLVRLERTRDFSGNQQPLAQQMCGMLKSMTEDEELKKLFLIHMSVNNSHCEDRAAMAFNELYTSWKVKILPLETPLRERLNILIRGAKTLALRTAIAESIDRQQQEKQTIEQESVEIYLFYELALEERLNLLSAIQKMRYGVIGQRDWIQADDLIAAVEKSYVDHLIGIPLFAKMLEQNEQFQEMWGSQAKEFVETLEMLSDRGLESSRHQGEMDALQAGRQQKYVTTVKQWLGLQSF